MARQVLLVVPSISRTGGGVAESVRLLAWALSARSDISIEVLTLRTNFHESDKQNWPDIPIHAFRYFGPSNYGFSPGMAWHLWRCKADLVHVHGIWMFPCLAVWIWHRKGRRPYVVSTHGMLESWIIKRSPRLKKTVSMIYQNRFLRNATMLHVLTSKEAIDVASTGIDTAPCMVIPNFVKPEDILPERPSWWLPQMQGRRIYLFFGRIHDKKGWQELCEAWERVCERNTNFLSSAYLVFCGWPDECPAFVPRIDELTKRYGNVQFAGPQHGAARALSLHAADVFVLPSKSEGLPMVVLEAWAAGLATLLTSACNLEIGFEREAAIRIGSSVGDIETTLEHVHRMSSAELLQIGESGRRLVAEQFSEDAVAEKFISLYKNSISGAKLSVARSV